MQDVAGQDSAKPHRDAALWLTVAEAVSHKVGHEFLGGLVLALRDSVQADLVFIAMREPGPGPEPAVRAICALEDGEPIDGFRYELDGAPCAIVYGGQEMVIPCDVAKMFPDEEGFEGYIGVPLYGDAGEVEGHLAVLSRLPIKDCPLALPLTRIFALRASAEYRREAIDQERRALLQDLEQVNDGLRRGYHAVHAANASRTRLLGVIAHDLRNPLAAIMCQAELAGTLSGGGAPDLGKIGKAGAKVVSNAERMAAMIQAALDRLKEESAGPAVRRQPTNLSDLVRIAIEANARAAVEKSITVAAEKPERLVAVVDEYAVLGAIDTLLDNAITFGSSGSTVRVSARAEGDLALISVADDGRGLSPEESHRTVGGNEEPPLAPPGEEAAPGLGLWMVKEVAEAHGGRVIVDSPEPGAGAVYTLVLPMAVAAGGGAE